MTYSQLFNRSGFSASASVSEIGGLESEIVLANTLLEQMETLGESEARLSAQADLLSDLVDCQMSHPGSKGARAMMFATIDNITDGAAEGVTGHSMEDFSEEGFSQEAMGGIKDAIGRGFDVVIEFIEKMIREAKVFISAFMDKFPALKKRAAKVKERAEKTEGTIETKKIQIGSAYAALTNGAKVVTGVADGLKVIDGLRDQAGLEKIPTWLEETRLDKLTGDADEIKALTVNELNKNADGDPESIFKGSKMQVIKSPTPKALQNGLRVIGVVDLLGDKTVAISSKKSSTITGSSLEKLIGRMASLKFGIYAQTEKLDVKDKEAETLDKSDVEKICEQVEAIAETYGRSKEEIREGLKAQEKMVTALKKIKANVDKEDYKEVKGTLNKAKSMVQNLATFATNPASKLSLYAYGTAVAALDYSEKSLAQYKK